MTLVENQNLFDSTKETVENLEKERLYQQHAFDDWLLKLCAGVFGVSFAFIEKLVDFSVAVWKPVLLSGWFLFALCLIFGVYNLMNTERVFRDDIIERWNDYQNKVFGTDFPTDLTRRRNGLAKVLNPLIFSSFATGVLCLVLFIAKNL